MEDDIQDDKNKKKPKITNSLINTFKDALKVNQIDDL